ncbi:metabotropic glutamate receptor 4-like [Asterias amurensis]|uniref:metabotropic glutamate receptor 4-like n=1 Tax=Asterias amurensis TaxID=7602 RepID=UPI003AB1318D
MIGVCGLFVLIAHIVVSTYIPREVCTTYSVPGDVNIGGLFSLHGDGDVSEMEGCRGRYPVSALQLTEAMAFAVMTINQDDSVLPNVTLGFIIHDDCSWPEYSIWCSLSLVLGAQPSLEDDFCNIPGPNIGTTERMAVGIIGTAKTSSSEVVINTVELFERPLVSYGATDQELHGEHGHPYFFSTIPSDSHKAEAIVDILAHYNWEYTAVVYSSDHDIMHLLHDILDLANSHSMCMDVQVMLSEVPTVDELRVMVEVLQEHRHAKVILLLVSSAAAANAVMSAVSTAEPPLERTWVASDSWGTQLVRDRRSQGGVFIEYSKPKLTEFEEYFRSLLTGLNTTQNPWFNEFCSGSDICQESSEEGFSGEIATLAPTIDAVLSVAYALDQTISDLCNNSISNCIFQKGFDDNLFRNLQKVSFPGTRGQFEFEGNFVPAQVSVKNMQRQEGGGFELVEIGSWSSVLMDGERLTIDERLVQWVEGNSDIPQSVCRDVCPVGYVEEIDSTKRCCWKCRACRVDDIVVGTECVSCEQNEWPNSNYTVCDKLHAKTVTWDEPAVISLIFLSSLGLLLCVLATIGMIKHRRHPLIKASSRELSCVNLLGLFLSFVTVYPLLCPPSATSCGMGTILYVSSFTLIFASLLLKVNRIYRIFESSTKTVRPPRYTGPIAQLVIVALLVMIQPLLILITALVKPGSWTSIRNLFPIPPRNQPRTLEIFCDLDIGFLVAMSYNFALLGACCFFAYKARNVPGNFNEARFYVASVYTTLVPILAAMPMYFTADNAISLAISICLVLIINGYVTVGCVYLPKLYIATFKKVTEQENNHQSLSVQSRRTFVLSGDSNRVHPSTS